MCIPVELIEEFKQESFRSYRKIQFGMVGCEDTQKRIIKSTAREVMYNGINLLTLGGRDDNEKARRIARKLWTIEELRKIVIDNTRRSGTRKAADTYRTKLFRDAMKTVIHKSGEVDQIFIDIRYKYALRSANGTSRQGYP